MLDGLSYWIGLVQGGFGPIQCKFDGFSPGSKSFENCYVLHQIINVIILRLP